MVAALYIAALAPQGTLNFKEFDAKMPSGLVVKADRGMLEVPEVRGKEGARKLQLSVVRLRSVGGGARPPVFYLDGGPGGSAIAAAQEGPTGAILERLLARHDVVLMDQRGTGLSRPSTLWLADEPLPDNVFESEEKVRAVMERWHKKAAEHFKVQGMDFRGYNTVEAADDLGDLITALGAPKVCLFGVSYGTHLTLATLRRHGARIDSAVLVGTEGLDETMKLPSVYNAQFAKISALASHDPALKGLVPDFAALTRRVMDKLEQKPIRVVIPGKTEGLPFGKFGLQAILRFDIGDGNDIPDLPRMVYALEQGDTKHLVKYVQKRFFQLGRGVSAMATLTDAASGASALRLKQIEEETPGCLLGNAVNLALGWDGGAWGDIDLGEAFRAPFHSNVRTLFVSGTLDSNTPPYQAERVRWGFSDARHLIVTYAGHEDMLPDGGVQDQIARFLGGLEPDRLAIDLPKPKFLGIG